MTTDHPTFRAIFLAARQLGIAARVLIAGGAVVDLATATDIDVFVLKDFHDGGATSVRLLDRLDPQWVAERNPTMYLEAVDDRQVAGHACFSVGTTHPATPAFPTPIHVVASESSDWQGVLNSFDLSICRWGVDHDLYLLRGIEASTPGQPTRILRMTTTTPTRAAKYQERFGLVCA